MGENEMKLILTFGLCITIFMVLSGCQTDEANIAGQTGKNPTRVVTMSIVNTTGNTFVENGEWQSTMGPLNTERGGLACDNTVSDMKFHNGEYRIWHLAPSDSIAAFGIKKCAKGTNGEPSCSENWGLCGRKVRVTCLNSKYCGEVGGSSLVSQINNGNPPTNNYLPKHFVDELTQRLGKNPNVADSVVLYITDFCPARHSLNMRKGQCQKPQVDISTSAFLLLGKTDEQGYINTNMKVSVELLDANDPTPVGPRMGKSY